MTKRSKPQLSRTFVPTRMVTRVFRLLDIALDAWNTDNCKVALILGEPGSGKTRVVKEWAAAKLGLDEYPHYTDELLRIPYTEVLIGSKAKALTVNLLNRFGHPHPNRGTLADQIGEVAALSRPDLANPAAQLIDAVILDEFHNVIDKDTNKVSGEAATWLTTVLNFRACPLIVVGEPSIERVFVSRSETGQKFETSQAKRRMVGVEYLDPFRWSDKEDRQEFRVILHHISQEIGLPEFVDLGEVGFALRIHNFSRGYLGQAVQLIEAARDIAVYENKPMLTQEMFAEAIDMLRLKSERTLLNPFRVSNPPPGDGADDN